MAKSRRQRAEEFVQAANAALHTPGDLNIKKAKKAYDALDPAAKAELAKRGVDANKFTTKSWSRNFS